MSSGCLIKVLYNQILYFLWYCSHNQVSRFLNKSINIMNFVVNADSNVR